MKALVLGGRGDIGGAISQRLSADGMDVHPVGRQDFDLCDSSSVDKFFSRNQDVHFSVVVHSAGLNSPRLFEQLSDAEIRHSLEANLHGFLRVVRWCLPGWKAGRFGRLLVISSLYGFLARKGRLPYVVSKHALNGAVKTLAIELAPHGVLVNSISPGFIKTKMTYQNNSPEYIERLCAGIPVGRLGEPEEIADVASFLCSKKNRYLTGQDIVVDGGFSVGGFQG